MPIDKMMLDPMLGTFRTMAKECEEKGASGDAFDRMKAALARMEALGQEMSDFAAFSAKMTTEGLQMNFSTAYGEVLADLNKPASDGSDYDDAALLKQTLDAYRDAIKRIKEGKATAQAQASKFDANKVDKLFKEDMLVKPIEDAIAFGESGVSFPVFLREMIVRGLDKAIEGSAVLKDGLEYSLEWAKASNISPHHIAEQEEILAKFNQLASAAKFNVPDSLTFELERKLIEHKHAPAIAHWSLLTNRWQALIDDLDHWAWAHMSFAPTIEPWSLAANPKEAVERTKDCTPGSFKIREEIFTRNFNMSFLDIFSHETFKLEVETFRLGYSQEYIEFLVNSIYPACQPLKHLENNLAKEVERLYKEKRMQNPQWHKVNEKVQAHHDRVFGEGTFAAQFDVPQQDTSLQASAWNLASFSPKG